MKFCITAVVDAFQYEGDFMNADGSYCCPDWVVDAFKKGIVFHDGPNTYVKTKERTVEVQPFGYLVKGVDNEIHCYEREVFELLFKKVEE